MDLVDQLKDLLERDPQQFLSALVNLVDTAAEHGDERLTKRLPQREREALIVTFIKAHFVGF